MPRIKIDSYILENELKQDFGKILLLIIFLPKRRVFVIVGVASFKGDFYPA